MRRRGKGRPQRPCLVKFLVEAVLANLTPRGSALGSDPITDWATFPTLWDHRVLK